MRIIGGKDYYDHGLGMGYDPTDPVVLVRDKNHNNFLGPDSEKKYPFLKEMTGFSGLNINYWGTSSSFRIGEKAFHINGVGVFFCGKFYQGMRISFNDEYGEYDHRKPFKVVWSPEELFALLKRKTNYTTQWEYCASRYDLQIYRPVMDMAKLFSSIDKFFVCASPSDEFMDFVRANRLSFITHRPAYNQHNIGYKNWYLNHDDLGVVEFYKVFDSYQAFQELSMWVGNMSTKENDMYQLSDSELIAKHGFDKWSFRKMPS